MKSRIQSLSLQQEENQSTQLKAVFNSQFQAFAKKPAIISVIFAEGIFHYDEKLSKEVAEIMDFMQEYVTKNITKGQKKGQYSKMIDASTLATIIIGGMRMTILKWKLSGYTSNLTKEGNMVLESTLKMFETNKL